MLKDGKKNNKNRTLGPSDKKAATILLPGRSRTPQVGQMPPGIPCMPRNELPLFSKSPFLFSVFQGISFPGPQLTPNLCPRILSFSRKPRLGAAYSQNQPKCPLKLSKGLLYYNILAQRPPQIMPGTPCFQFKLSHLGWCDSEHSESIGRRDLCQVPLLEQPKHLPQLRKGSMTSNFLSYALLYCFLR